ncbi:MAG TPA: hypothetical protein VF292_11360 [Rhodanobacteraceae bacterium]
MTTKAEVWRQRLAACRASKQSMAAYCRAQGWPYAQCIYWQRRLSQRALGLIPIQVAPSTHGATTLVADGSGLAVELRLPGALLRIRGVTVADVTALVRSLSC